MTKTFRKDTERCRSVVTIWNCSKQQYVCLNLMGSYHKATDHINCRPNLVDAGSVI